MANIGDFVRLYDRKDTKVAVVEYKYNGKWFPLVFSSLEPLSDLPVLNISDDLLGKQWIMSLVWEKTCRGLIFTEGYTVSGKEIQDKLGVSKKEANFLSDVVHFVFLPIF